MRIDHYASLGGALCTVGPFHEHWAVAALIRDLACGVDLVMTAPATVFPMLAPGVATRAALVVRTQTHDRSLWVASRSAAADSPKSHGGD